VLNEAQQRRLLANAKHADALLSEIEAALGGPDSQPAFPKYRPDASLHQARLIRSYLARFRSHLIRGLTAAGVEYERPQLGALHSVRVTLTFVRIALQEMAPERLRGYGDLPQQTAAELRGLCAELEGLVSALERNLALGNAADLQSQLARLPAAMPETELLRRLEGVVDRHALAEFRSPLLNLVDKMESPRFEIAVFGRVSSGKSSLLNHILGTDVLPVGVNPITAVPTRLVFGGEALVTVTFANRQVQRYPITELARHASEEQNPGNQLGVAKLVVSLPSPRLRDGLVLVDTPGLGGLASAGTAETLAYLPQCDLGILLISATNPVDGEDLDTIRALAQAGIPVMVLLSKADLLAPADRTKALAYTQQEMLAHLNLNVIVHPVSTAENDGQLLEQWFRGELAPLHERHRELAYESMRRKAGALRESVVAALRSKAGHQAADRDGLEETERRLRETAGQMEEVRRACIAAADEMRTLAPPPDAVEAAAREAAAQIAARLRALARQLDSALALAAHALGGSAPDGSLEECLREMPRFEAALPPIEQQAGWFRASRERRLRREIQPQIEAAFIGYARSIETWVRTVLKDIALQFDARADAYRAQLARLAARSTVSAEEQARIESDIAGLEMPFTEDGRPAHPCEAPRT